MNDIGLSKQVATPITAAVPYFVSVMEQISIALAHGMQLMSWHAFSSMSLIIDHRKQFGWKAETCRCLTEGHASSSTVTIQFGVNLIVLLSRRTSYFHG